MLCCLTRTWLKKKQSAAGLHFDRFSVVGLGFTSTRSTKTHLHMRWVGDDELTGTSRNDTNKTIKKKQKQTKVGCIPQKHPKTIQKLGCLEVPWTGPAKTRFPRLDKSESDLAAHSRWQHELIYISTKGGSVDPPVNIAINKISDL